MSVAAATSSSATDTQCSILRRKRNRSAMATSTIILQRTGRIFLSAICLLFTSCSGPDSSQAGKDRVIDGTLDIVRGDTVPEIGRNIRSIVQDHSGNIWFGSDEEGVYRYDGKSIVRFTDRHGLCHNQIRTIQEDESGNIYFGTGNGVSRFDGRAFTTLIPDRRGVEAYTIRQSSPRDLWFDGDKGGVYRYDGNSLTYLKLPRTDLEAEYYARYPGSTISPYGVYCIFKDSKGNLWFGTEYLGVCRYNGESFTWFSEKGLSGGAVRTISEDKDGNLWFGKVNLGLFRYDGKNLITLTGENEGSDNSGVFKALRDKTVAMTEALGRKGRQSSVMAVNVDHKGEIWIGTYESGVWRYDGNRLTHYTTDDGLPSNAITAIYTSREGELWVGTTEAGVYVFNGRTFTKFAHS